MSAFDNLVDELARAHRTRASSPAEIRRAQALELGQITARNRQSNSQFRSMIAKSLTGVGALKAAIHAQVKRQAPTKSDLRAKVAEIGARATHLAETGALTALEGATLDTLIARAAEKLR